MLKALVVVCLSQLEQAAAGGTLRWWLAHLTLVVAAVCLWWLVGRQVVAAEMSVYLQSHPMLACTTMQSMCVAGQSVLHLSLHTVTRACQCLSLAVACSWSHSQAWREATVASMSLHMVIIMAVIFALALRVWAAATQDQLKF